MENGQWKMANGYGTKNDLPFSIVDFSFAI
jgi:hypothetical protein